MAMAKREKGVGEVQWAICWRDGAYSTYRNLGCAESVARMTGSKAIRVRITEVQPKRAKPKKRGKR